MEEINSGNPVLDEQIRNWLEWDQKGSESFLKIQKMVNDKMWEDLDKIMTKVSRSNNHRNIDRVSYFSSIPENMFQVLSCKIQTFSEIPDNLSLAETAFSILKKK